MAKDILDEIDDDFDEDSVEDILEDVKDEAGQEETTSFKKKGTAKIKDRLKQGFKSKKTRVVIAVLLVLLTGLAIGLWLFFSGSDSENMPDVQNTKAAEKQVQAGAPREDKVVFEDIVDLEPFERIPLKAGSTMGLVSVTLSLELTDPKHRKQVYALEEKIREIITDQAEQMTWQELRNPEGKLLLKYNLLKQMNSIFPKVMIRNIYFTHFIMQ